MSTQPIDEDPRDAEPRDQDPGIDDKPTGAGEQRPNEPAARGGSAAATADDMAEHPLGRDPLEPDLPDPAPERESDEPDDAPQRPPGMPGGGDGSDGDAGDNAAPTDVTTEEPSG